MPCKKIANTFQLPGPLAPALASTPSAPAGKKPRKEIPWAKNPSWTQRVIEYLSTNTSFHIELFLEKANQENQQKAVGGVSKVAAYEKICDWQKRYKSEVMKLSETGHGLHADEMTEDSNIKNLYVTNSEAGKDHSARAESLFHGDSERPHTPSMDNEEIPEMLEVEANQEDNGLNSLAEEFAGLDSPLVLPIQSPTSKPAPFAAVKDFCGHEVKVLPKSHNKKDPASFLATAHTEEMNLAQHCVQAGHQEQMVLLQGQVTKRKYHAEAEAETWHYAENHEAHQHELEMEKLKLWKMELELSLQNARPQADVFGGPSSLGPLIFSPVFHAGSDQSFSNSAQSSPGIGGPSTLGAPLEGMPDGSVDSPLRLSLWEGAGLGGSADLGSDSFYSMMVESPAWSFMSNFIIRTQREKVFIFYEALNISFPICSIQKCKILKPALSPPY
ncbi:hypothetical protein BS47DRAFT_1368307 [Hydnum rufescens UP504]|uniref:Uncharacterized protein n=1 Tax=Hydnum rufescens UP504 TaxID=1448309 RepID=A0A9P6DNZ0_9AGAM|nr:hypothetical protein BS47DRAFT_1368307 [Hydnum rufescens UP504]